MHVRKAECLWKVSTCVFPPCFNRVTKGAEGNFVKINLKKKSHVKGYALRGIALRRQVDYIYFLVLFVCVFIIVHAKLRPISYKLYNKSKALKCIKKNYSVTLLQLLQIV